jgi:Flp pilus assembly protein TadD
MPNSDPRALEATAFRLQREGKYAEAAELFERILRDNPNWEDGGGAFSLAFCLEEIGDFNGALRAYKMALSYDPTNEIFLGGYNSLRTRIV